MLKGGLVGKAVSVELTLIRHRSKCVGLADRSGWERGRE